MTYIIKQKVRGRPYAYEVSAYWDPIKKQSRQKRKYVGAYDERGNIVKKMSQRQILTVKTFGSVYILTELGIQSGLRKQLTKCFGKDGDLILAQSIGKVLSPTALRNMHYVMEENYIPEILNLSFDFTSQRLSDFLTQISKMQTEMFSFFTQLAKGSDALIYDLTTMSSYSKNLEFIEYGSHYKETGLPQFNVGLVYSITNRSPIYFKIFPGTINDVVTLKNLMDEIKIMGVKESMFILDRGFYSIGNIEGMLTSKVDFIMPIPFNITLAKELISETNRKIQDPINGRMYNDQLYYVISKNVEIASSTIKAFIIHNEQRRADEKRTLFAKIEEIETKFDGKVWDRKAQESFEAIASKQQHFFEIRVIDNLASFKRKTKAITHAANRCGKMILLSSKEMPWDEALGYYRERDQIEKEINHLKNELEALPVRVHKMDTLRGLMFIFFISLILRSKLMEKASKAKLLKRSSLEDLLFDMGKLKAVLIGQDWRLSEISKKQRGILTALKIDIPKGLNPR